MSKWVPRCSKRTLLIFAALVWMMAGSMVMKLGYEVVLKTRGHKEIAVIVAVTAFLIFYNLIFKKMAAKHQRRIAAKTQDKLCVFSFFDKKSYIIMGSMMTLGIVIRSLTFIDPMCWAPFYIGLGTALFGAGVLFGIAWFKWRRVNTI
ncbi:MAG: hypothetical protein ACRCTE_04480 [Cellulosilyticaceae bacterium]